MNLKKCFIIFLSTMLIISAFPNRGVGSSGQFQPEGQFYWPLLSQGGGSSGYTLGYNDVDFTPKLSQENRPPGSEENLNQGKPKVITIYPEGDTDTWYNEKELNKRIINNETRYFLKVIFEDIDGTLEFNETGLDLLKTSSVFAQGNEVSMVDIQFINYIQNLDIDKRNEYISNYIFEKHADEGEAHLCIPVKPLKPNTTYTVILNSGIVYHKDNTEEQNNTIIWSFTTTAIPLITGIDLGSIFEDYYKDDDDDDEADKTIILRGKGFSRNAQVYFNDIEAKKVRLKHDVAGNPYLLVYLPTARGDRLKPGIYTVRVRNDKDHEFEVYGFLSVVKRGDYVPNPEYKIKYDGSKGEVRGSIEKSEDTLILDSDYTDRRRVELDLDEIMCEDVLLRNIEFKGSRSSSIGKLITLSKWADITFYNLRKTRWSSDKVNIALGRAEPSVQDMIKRRLGPLRLKSEIIQVTGKNWETSSIVITMPFKQSSGENIKVLRYDLDDMTFYEEFYFVDKTEKTVEITSSSPGIFMIVE